MISTQRLKNDIATIDRRQMTDFSIRENRIRNDELTRDRRVKYDKILRKKRLRNDEITESNREIKDGNPRMTFVIFLLLLLVLTVGIYLFVN